MAAHAVVQRVWKQVITHKLVTVLTQSASLATLDVLYRQLKCSISAKGCPC